MNSSLRLTCISTVAACLTLAVRLSGADTPTSKPATAAPSVAAATPAATPVAAPTPTPRPTPQLPKSFEGLVTQDEYNTFVKFQLGLREDPEISALNVQIRGKMNEMLDLQKKVQAAQQKAIESHPDIKAIADKIMKGKAKPAGAAPGAAKAAAPVSATAPAPTTPPK